MNAEQKQRAIASLTKFWAADSNKAVLSTGYEMAGVLQELIDAPDPEPVGYTNETELDYVRKYESLPVSGTFWPTSDEDACVALYTAPPANNQSEQHLEMVNPPAPSAPDVNLEPSKEQLTQLINGVGKCFTKDSVREFLRVWVRDWTAHKLAAQQTFNLARDAERYRWLRTYNTAKHPSVTEAFFLGDENLDAEIDAAIAAEKVGQP